MLNRKNDEIEASELTFLHSIGEGNYSHVLKAAWHGKPVAVKVMPFSKFDLDKCLHESEVMATLSEADPQHIVNYYGHMQCDSEFSIVMEFLSQGSLEKYMSTHPEAPSWELRLRWLIDITTALDKIHDHKMAYCDLKTANVLLTDDLHAKLCDFGFCNDKLKEQADARGTFPYAAPEFLTHPTEHNTKQSDIYTWGTLARSIVAWKEPFFNFAPAGIYKRIQENKPQKIPTTCPKTLSALIKQSWFTKPKERPTTKELLVGLEETRKEIAKPRIP